jgi:hypothetical protein
MVRASPLNELKELEKSIALFRGGTEFYESAESPTLSA